MARIILVTGGCRSGKSAYAQKLAESLPGKRTYIATAPVIDAEMRDRVRKHRQARAKRKWKTIEELVNLAAAISAADADVILIDCLTLWINNVMYEAEQAKRKISERQIERLTRELAAACRGREGNVIFVTNEVGMGIVPDNALARRYRDLVGRCNQTLAAAADAVTLVACGIPLQLKGS